MQISDFNKRRGGMKNILIRKSFLKLIRHFMQHCQSSPELIQIQVIETKIQISCQNQAGAKNLTNIISSSSSSFSSSTFSVERMKIDRNKIKI